MLTEKSELAAEAAGGNTRREFEELVRKYHAPAYNVAYRMSGDRTLAEDLTQETFVRAYRFFANYRRDLPFESWLYKIMSNLWIDTLRRKPKGGPHISLDQTYGEGEQSLDIPDSAPTPEADVLTRTLDSRIRDALLALPKPFRMAVILADIEGMSYEEIADVMKCSVGTVRSRIHRGRRSLRQKLGSVARLQGEE